MRKYTLLFVLLSMSLVAVAQEGYSNPVIPGFHPDPSVCQVGDKFYLVNSSVQYFPGVPIYESEDLAHWSQIGNVLDRESQVSLVHATSWLGIYAPTIRYHDGLFYLISTNVSDGGNFMVTACDPEGPWSEPIWIEQKGIDPSLLFENGKCYLVSNPGGVITLCEIEPATGKQLTEGVGIWRGTGGRYPEGPHIYKIGEWYYLLISEGGSELAHKLTVARSRDIYGPYESNPANPILTHCNQAGQGSQIQGTGHGDLVQDSNGNWWMVFLAYRNYGGSFHYHHLGRETFLSPVTWENGWPVVNGGKPVETEMNGVTLPGRTKRRYERYLNTAKDGFERLGPEWVYMQNPDSSKYEHLDKKLRLHGSQATLSSGDCPTFLGRRQEAAEFSCTLALDGSGLEIGDETGLAVFQCAAGHMEVALRHTEHGFEVISRVSVRTLIKESLLFSCSGSRVFLKAEAKDKLYLLSASEDGENYSQAEPMSWWLMSTEVVGGFTGVVLGMYATGSGSADFSFFDYREAR